MEAEPPLYPVAGAAGPQGDEDRLGVPDGPEAPVSRDADGAGTGRAWVSPAGVGCGPGGRGRRGWTRERPGSAFASGRGAPQLDELVGAYPNYNEEEEERRYYRRKRLGVLKNVLAASAGGMLTYGVYLGRWPAARPAGGLGPGPGEEARPAGSPPPLLRLRLRT